MKFKYSQMRGAKSRRGFPKSSRQPLSACFSLQFLCSLGNLYSEITCRLSGNHAYAPVRERTQPLFFIPNGQASRQGKSPVRTK